ncbi:hypothetical protein AC1031_012134 [Aphanomyces cochlioides]|nr:hypothetical protein AC1031_012134 [Aphanomyces cochlioides]
MARLRLVQVLHRHGDRSPLHNVYGSASTLASREDALWKSKLQEPTSGRGIYGELTRHGVAQMEQRGAALREHFLARGWTMDKLDLQVFSTHYVRTQRSVQALLSQFAPEESPSIEILPKHSDFINAYNTHGPMISAVKDSFVSTHPPVVEREAAMAPIKAELMRLLPMYSTERFTWMNAADYFVCRQAHGLDYITHTEVGLNPRSMVSSWPSVAIRQRNHRPLGLPLPSFLLAPANSAPCCCVIGRSSDL